MANQNIVDCERRWKGSETPEGDLHYSPCEVMRDGTGSSSNETLSEGNDVRGSIRQARPCQSTLWEESMDEENMQRRWQVADPWGGFEFQCKVTGHSTTRADEPERMPGVTPAEAKRA